MPALGKYYVSVTGLLTKGWLCVPKFLYRSSNAYNDALKAEGNVYSSIFAMNGVQHTLTVWENKEAMQKFMRGDAHSKAMRSLKEVSRYVKVHGYWTNQIPSADEAIMEWKSNGRRVYGEPTAQCGDEMPVPCWECTEFEHVNREHISE